MRKRVERTIVTMALAGTCCLALAPMAMAGDVEPVAAPVVEEVRPEADVSVDILSQYVWRGYALSGENIVIQPSMTVGYKGFAFNLWGNLDTDQEIENTNSWTETDMTISYDWSMAGVDLGVGYIYYGLEGDDSQEFYGGVSKDFGFMSAGCTVYRDTDAFPGWYISTEVGSSVPVGDFALDLGFAAGYLIADDTQVDGGDYSDFMDGVFSMSMSFDVAQYVTVTPLISYSFPLSGEADDLLEISNDGYGSDEDILYGGVSASFSF